MGGNPGVRNSGVGINMDCVDVKDPADIVDKGMTAGGMVGMSESGKASIAGICGSGPGVVLKTTGELPRDEAMSDEFPFNRMGTVGWWCR